MFQKQSPVLAQHLCTCSLLQMQLVLGANQERTVPVLNLCLHVKESTDRRRGDSLSEMSVRGWQWSTPMCVFVYSGLT